jgi:hypothetical protein
MIRTSKLALWQLVQLDLAAAMRSDLAEMESRLNECSVNEAAAIEGGSYTARI